VTTFVFGIDWFFPFGIDKLLSEISPSTPFLIWETIMSIYVGNLSYEVTSEDIAEVFSEYGEIERVYLPTDRETGRVRGFAFVEMRQESDEAAAIEALDGAEWMNRVLKVNPAKPRENKPRSSRGDWGKNRNFSGRY